MIFTSDVLLLGLGKESVTSLPLLSSKTFSFRLFFGTVNMKDGILGSGTSGTRTLWWSLVLPMLVKGFHPSH